MDQVAGTVGLQQAVGAGLAIGATLGVEQRGAQRPVGLQGRAGAHRRTLIVAKVGSHRHPAIMADRRQATQHSWIAASSCDNASWTRSIPSSSSCPSEATGLTAASTSRV